MTQLIDLGKLRFSFAGEWNSSTVYESNDIVKYGGNVYVYTYGLKTSSHLPTDTTYWALMVEGIKFKGIYDNAVAYKVGDGVAHGGKVYIAVIDTTAHIPPNTTYWSQFADGIQYEGTYASAGQYQKNDIVSYGSSGYIALQDTSGNLPTNATYWAKLIEGVSVSGAWNAATAYVPNDVVAYGANQYKSIANNTNQLPINATGALNSNWILMTEGIRARGVWATATEYYINDVVQRGGNSYICVVRNGSTVFETDLSSSKWVKFNGGIRWRGMWVTGTSYLKDDVVKDSVGSAYIATMDHTSGAGFSTDLASVKWTQFVVGGSDVLPTIQASDTGQSLSVKADGVSLEWLGATQSSSVYYVAPHGTDSPTCGKNLSTPFASVKYATTVCGENATIFVKTGTYNEQLPIIVPAHVAIVGDNQRTTIIQPASGNSDDGVTPNNQSTMFMLSNGAIMNKMTFKGMTGWVPGTTPEDVTTSTIKGVVFRFNPSSPITTKSPYVLECAFIGSGAIGAIIDGSVHTSGAKTMIFHGYTVITDNGIGYWVKDGGKSEIVSCFTYYAYFGYTASGGGFIRALNGNNSYGTWGATSRGFDGGETPNVGSLVGEQLPFTYGGGLINIGDTVSNGSGGTAIVTNVQYSSDKIYIKERTGNFAANQALTFTSGGTGTAKSNAESQRGFVLVASGFSALPKPGASVSLAGDTYSYVIQSTTGTWANTSSEVTLLLAQEKPSGSAAGTGVTIRYKYSQIRLTGHDFLSIGTGGITTTNYPGNPTQPSSQGNETDEKFPGRVFYVSTDQDGNFRVGEYFRIDQATGKATLNASAFDLSGLSSLRLGSIGAQLGEQINEFSSDATMSGNSNLAVPTEYAVKAYTDAKSIADRAYALSVANNVSSSLNSVLGESSLSVNPSGTASSQYRAFFATGSGTFSWSLSGSPPSGVTVNQTGLLSIATGITANTYTFNIVVTSGSTTVSKPVTLVVSTSVPAFSTAALPSVVTPSTSVSYSFATASPAATFSVTSGSLPSWLTLNTTTGTLTGSSPGQNLTDQTFTFTVTAVNGAYQNAKSFAWTFTIEVITNQALFGTNVGFGTFSWVAPKNANGTVCAVCVGAGGWGGYQWSSGGNGGGGLGYKNNIPVVTGQTYTVQVGSYGTQQANSSTNPGGTPSFFINTTTVAGYSGGTGGPNSVGSGGANGGGWVGDGGGRGGSGGSGSWTGGGGGAGGYSGNGGNNDSGGSGGGGGGSSGYYSSTWGTGGGGGVGLNGQGTSGSTSGYNPWSPGYTGSGGQGGSGGADGTWGELPWSNGTAMGGNYGGGGGGSGSTTSQNYPHYNFQRGGAGGVRLIWGAGRAFPSTSTADI
ncbi:Pectinesterase, catalytic [uncultured Caudovirales phage]|uniref:Pectinesterase, catalytic n=1 Tax=uncultured Caudovirales phage TaxID=2100421 RepID=A0A6J5RJB3_9CAUD|nr:Pectinesterase, catalytic [uncultured Caudovirales phage]